MNEKNLLGLNSCFGDFDDPFALFKEWMNEAKKKEINDPNALSLATTNDLNEPSVRIVLLKDFKPTRFVFYTNLNSPKSQDLKKNLKAAMCFHWKSIERQIRISGNVSQVSDLEANQYFDTRPLESRIGAIASEQSNVMKDREELLNKIKTIRKKNKEDPTLARPKHWSGWSLKPYSYEFWLAKKNRIHERLRYKSIKNKWQKEILYP